MRYHQFTAAALAGTALAAALPAAGQTVVATTGTQLVVTSPTAPGTAQRTVTVSGLPAGVTLTEIDQDPTNRRTLFGVTTTGQVLRINPVTGATIAVPGNTGQTGVVAAGVNPTNNGLRIVSPTTRANIAFNTTTGAVTTQTPVAYAVGDAGAGTAPRVVAAGYTPAPFGGTTTLYVIDSARGVLATQGNVGGAPAGFGSGQLFTVGALGVTTTDAAALRVAQGGQAYATLTNGGVTSLYLLNTTTGAATLVGALPGATTYSGFAFTLPTLASFGATANTAAVGGVLDTLTLTPGVQGVQTLIGSVDAETTAEGRNAQLLALSPAALGSLTQLTLQSLQFQDDTVRRYLRDVRQGGTESGAQAVKFGTDRQFAMWLNANGRFGTLKGDTDRNRVSYGSFAVIGGVDARAARGTLVGLYGGYDVGSARLSPLAPRSDAETWFGGGYASGTLGPVFIDLHGSYGQSMLKPRRAVGNGLGEALPFGYQGREPKSEQFQGTATAGLSVDLRGIEVEPYGGAKYANIKLRGFSEGFGPGAYTLPRLSTDSLQSIAGLRLGAKIPLTQTAILRAKIRGEWRHEFENAGRDRNLFAGFADGAGNLIPLGFRTNALDRDYAAVGGGITVSGNSPISLVIDYNGEIARDRSIHGITGGFNLAF